MAAPAPPAAETKKPAPPPPAKDDKAGKGGKPPDGKAGAAADQQAKGSAGDKAAGKTAEKAGGKPEAKGAATGDKAAAAGQQRFDRMAVRAKLAVSEPGDAVEREADAVAAKVMRMAEPAAGREKPAAPAAATRSDQPQRKEEAKQGSAGATPKDPARGAAPAGGKPAAAPAAVPEQAAKPAAAGQGKDPLQRKEAASGGDSSQSTADRPGTTQELVARLGGGEPLDADTRAYFEKRMGADFSQVRIHADAAAAQAARQIDARAFTYGQHIAFASGAYQPQSESGRFLLAHELAHVMQQSAGTISRSIMRKPNAAAAGGNADEFEIKKNKLQIPPIKSRHSGAYGSLAKSGKLRRKGAYDAASRGTKQVGIWLGAAKPEINKIPAKRRPSATAGWNLNLDVKGGVSAKLIPAGSEAELVRLLKIPTWDANGKDVEYQVDHMVEFQLGGDDAIENMELLDQAHNGSVGSSFAHAITRVVNAEIRDDPDNAALKGLGSSPSAATVMEAKTVVFKEVEHKGRDSKRSEGATAKDKAGSSFWSLQEINALAHVLPMLGDEGDLSGTASSFALLSPTGNLLIGKFSHASKSTTIKVGEAQSGGIAGLKIASIKLNSGYNDVAAGGNIGSLEGTLYFGPSVNVPKDKKVNVGISQATAPGSYSGKLGKDAGDGTPNVVDFKPMSPLELSDISIGKSVFAKALLKPSHPALDGVQIPAEIRDGRLGLFYSIDATALASRLKIPGVVVESASIDLGYDGEAFSIGGGAEFSIKKFGTGFLNARADSGGDFELLGGLRADKRLFDQADMKLWYRKKGGFGGSGTLGITQPGKIKGIKSAALSAKYEDSVFSADGTVIPDIPGLKAASLSVTYANEELVISGKLGIDDKVPGVQAADISVTVKQSDAGWKVAASGDVTPKLPALSGANLKFSYDDGFVLIEGEFSIEKGPVSGKFKAGVTNGTVDDKGVRSDAGSGDKFTAFGAAEVDAVFIKDRLAGKLRLRLLPDGTVRVGGDLKVADFEVFPQIPKDGGEFLNKEISSPRIPLPGAGFSVGSMSIGVTFWASGHIKAHASVGPGRMTGITLTIAEFDPASIDFNTLEVGGKAKFVVDGAAGVEVGADVNVGLSAAVVDLVGTLGVSGEVGIPKNTAILTATAGFTYSQAKGLDIGATCNLDISPSLTFKLKGGFSARLNLYVDTVTVWSKDWTLAEANFKLPVGITANGALNYNTKTDKLSVDPASAIKVKTPEFSADDFKRILDGSPAPDRVENVDANGKPAEGVAATVNPRREDGAAAADTPSAVDENIVGRLGAGAPLDLASRGFFEQRMQADFGGVLIHTGPAAAHEARMLSARAFAVGEHIAFADGQYRPDTPEGKELLAHELAHVAQRAQGSADRLARCTAGAAADPAAGNVFSVATGDYAGTRLCLGDERCLSLPLIQLPRLKERNAALFPQPLLVRREARPDTDQTTLWRDAVRTGAQTQLESLTETARDAGAVDASGGSETFFLTLDTNPAFLLFGTAATLQPRLEIPIWDARGRGTNFQVDHILEMQLNGEDVQTNYELLEGDANMGAGRAIAEQIRDTIKGGLTALQQANPDADALPSPNGWRNVKRNYQVSYRAIRWTLPHDGSANRDRKWSLQQVLDGEPAAMLRPMRPRERTRLGAADRPVIFASAQGGEPLPAVANPRADWIPRVDLLAWNAAGADDAALAGTLRVDVFKARTARARDDSRAAAASGAAPAAVAADYRDQPWRVRRVPGLNAGYVDPEDVRNVRNSLRLPGMSPIELDDIALSRRGLVGAGRVLPTVPLIADADIRIRIDGAEAQVYKTFSMDELHLPAPFRMEGCDLTVFYGSASGLGVDGRADFAVDRLGSGFLGATASTGGGFALEGGFDFDTRLFDRAGVTMAYRDEQLSLAGDIGIDSPDKIRGIRAADLHIAYAAGRFDATGTVEPDLPGVRQAGLRVEYDEAAGLVIGGNLELEANPAIRSGSIDVSLSQRDDGWRVAASGTAEPAIPGIDSTLSVAYDDGAFDASFAGSFERGMLSGTAEVGATNRPVDAGGEPAGAAEPGAPIVVYGGGTATLRIAPWLQGTAGIRFAPNGEVTVAGEIALPDTLEIFSRQQIERELFSFATQIPIVPGVVAEVGGNLAANAGIGPGVLDEARIGIEYNPEHEENTHVTGDAHLGIPADAGVRLGARAGIGLGITGASATGGLELGGTLGIAGAAEAAVHVDWMPSRGLQVDAEGSLHAAPRFRFDVSGYVDVSVLGASLYEQRWELAAYEVGSDFEFGVRFPIRYREGEPFTVATDDIVFDVPEIDPAALTEQLGAAIL